MRRSGNNQSQPLPPNFDQPFRTVTSGFDRAVASNGTATAVVSLAPLCYYRTNYGKITSIRDRLFQLIKSRRIFASFDVFRLALSILLTLDEIKKTKVSIAFLTAVRRGNDVRLTWAS
jgi:hypothetical protein